MWVTLDEVTRDSLVAFESALVGVLEIVEALRMMGQPDYLLRVVTSGPESFESLYMDVLAGLPHVKTPTSQLAMKAVKRTHRLPIDGG